MSSPILTKCPELCYKPIPVLTFCFKALFNKIRDVCSNKSYFHVLNRSTALLRQGRGTNRKN